MCAVMSSKYVCGYVMKTYGTVKECSCFILTASICNKWYFQIKATMFNYGQNTKFGAAINASKMGIKILFH
jgi:hypothetical protein